MAVTAAPTLHGGARRLTRDAEQQKYSEIAALVSITVGREQFRNAEPRFYTAWAQSRPTVAELDVRLKQEPPDYRDLIKRDVVRMAFNARRIGLSRQLMTGRRALGTMLRCFAREGRRRCHKHHDHDRD